MIGGRISNRVLFVRTVALTILFILVVPGIMAFNTDQTATTDLAKGGDTIVLFKDATVLEFNSVAFFINTHDGQTYAMNPPNSLRAVLPAGLGNQLVEKGGIFSIHTGTIDMRSVSSLNHETQVAASAWNLHLTQLSVAGPNRANTPKGAFATYLGDGSGSKAPVNAPAYHDGMAQIFDDAIICSDDSVCTADLSKAPEFLKNQAQGPSPMGPAPGLWDTTEFMLGTVGLAIVYPESNGSIDANSETWTGPEETAVVNGITSAFAWWVSMKNAQGITVPLSFSYKTYYKQATSYEPITRNGFSGAANANMWTWMNEILTNLGYGNGQNGQRAFANATRAQLGTDWGYSVWIARDQNDGNHMFADNTFGFAALGGPYVVMTYNNDGYGIGSMNAVFAHESGHIFFADDEYSGSGSHSGDRTGYENVLNGNAVDDSVPAHITNVGCIMRGTTAPFTGNQICGFTKGQIGWNDTDGDHIPNVVDTFPNTTLNSMPGKAINKTTYTYFGNASEVPLTNINPIGAGDDVTINTLTKVEWRLDAGGWTVATPIDGAWSNQSEAFKFTLNGLTEGTHKVEVRATNNRSNVEPEPANETFLVDTAAPSTQVSPLPQYQNTAGFKVNWTGTDGTGSGVKNVELYVRKDGGAWIKYLNKFASSPITYTHNGDGFYEFYTIGHDNASNVELAPALPDASTTVEATPPTSSARPLPAFTHQVAFNVPFKATDTGVGVDKVTLFYRKELGTWKAFGNFTTSPAPFTSAGDGKYDFYTIGYDMVANKENKFPMAEASLPVDTITPITNISLVGVNAQNGWYTSPVSVTLFTSEPSKNFNWTKYRIDDGNWTVYKGIFQIKGDGVRNLEFYSADLASNTETVKSRSLKMDLTIPTGSLVLNGGKIQTNDSNVDVKINAFDDGAPVIQMMVTEDKAFATSTWMDLSDHMNYAFKPVPGEKTLYAQFKNEAGLVSGVVSATVIMDNEAPLVKIIVPANGANLANYQFVVSGTAQDNVGLSRVEVSIDGTSWVVANGTEEWDTLFTVHKDGPYNITAVAYDKVGNKDTKTISVYVDASLPKVDINTPPNGLESEQKIIPVTGQTDPRATVKINGLPVTVDKNGTFSTTVSLKDGSNDIIITIKKPAGTIEKRIRVIYVHPPIIISNLQHNPVEPAPGDNVTVTCTVPGNHIKSVEVRYKAFGKTPQTVSMTKGPNDLYTARIGSFADGDSVDYSVTGADDVGVKATYPEKGYRNFIVNGPPPPPVVPPEPKKEDMSIYPMLFLLIIFAIFAVVIALSMRSPKDPRAPKKVSGKTAVERLDDKVDPEKASFPDGQGRGRSRYGEPPDTDRHSSEGGGYSRYKDEKY